MATTETAVDRAAEATGAKRIGAKAVRSLESRLTPEDVAMLGGMKIADPHKPLPMSDPKAPGALDKMESSWLNTLLWQLPFTPEVAGFLIGVGRVPYAGVPFRWLGNEIKKGYSVLEEHTLGDAMDHVYSGTEKAGNFAGVIGEKVGIKRNKAQAQAGGSNRSTGSGPIVGEAETVISDAAANPTLRARTEGALGAVGGGVDAVVEHPFVAPAWKKVRGGLDQYDHWRASGENPRTGWWGSKLPKGSAQKAREAQATAHGHIDNAIAAMEGEQAAYQGWNPIKRYTQRRAQPVDADIKQTVADSLHSVKKVLTGTKEKFGVSTHEELMDAHLIEQAGAHEKPKPFAHVLSAREKALEAQKEAFEKAAADLRKRLDEHHAQEIKAARAAGMSEAHINGVIKKSQEEVANGVDSALSNAGKELGKFAKHTAEGQNHLGDEAARLSGIKFRENFREGFKAIPEKLSKMKGTEAINHGLYYTSQAATAMRTVKLFTGNLDVLKHMYASLTDTPLEKVSTSHVLFGKVPHIMQEARHQYLKNALPQAAANLVSMDVFRRLMKNGATGKTMILGIGAQMAAGIGGGILADKNGMLDAYSTITQAQLMGTEVPAGGYLALLLHASKDVRGMDENDQKLLNVAKQYAKEKVTAAFVLKELDSGEFMKRYNSAPATATTDGKTPKPAVEAKAESKVAEVAKGEVKTDGARTLIDKAKELKPVQGEYTLKENARRAASVVENAVRSTPV